MSLLVDLLQDDFFHMFEETSWTVESSQHMSTSWGPISIHLASSSNKQIAKLLVNQSAKHLHNLSKCTFFNKLPRKKRPRRPEAQDILNMFDIVWSIIMFSCPTMLTFQDFPLKQHQNTSNNCIVGAHFHPFPAYYMHSCTNSPTWSSPTGFQTGWGYPNSNSPITRTWQVWLSPQLDDREVSLDHGSALRSWNFSPAD